MTDKSQGSDKKISTSQLAKRHSMETRELFELLSGAKWIVRNTDDKIVVKDKQAPGWLLTAKGEFEGGAYFSSDKFGTYIVWPASVINHPMIKEVQDKPLSSTQIGKRHHLHGRVVNQLLAEIGWIEQHIDGWVLTNLGRVVGGQSREHEKTGVHYVVWPQSVLQDFRLKKALMAFSLEALRDEGITEALDGHQHSCPERVLIDNWLYINGITHACNRSLDNLTSDLDAAKADFYLPQGRIFIEFWGAEEGAEPLLTKLQKLDGYRESQSHLIEVEAEHLSDLDDYLAKQLLKFGVKVYG